MKEKSRSSREVVVLERERELVSRSGGNMYILGNEEAVGLHSRGLEKFRGGGRKVKNK